MISFSKKLKISTFLNQQFYFSNLFSEIEHGNRNHGVPQGTVLGPLTFLLYVNDFSEKLEGENDLVQFVDDTSIICKFERNENIPQ